MSVCIWSQVVSIAVLLLGSYLDKVSRKGEVSFPTPWTSNVVAKGYGYIYHYLGHAYDSTNCYQHKQGKNKNKVLTTKCHLVYNLRFRVPDRSKHTLALLVGTTAAKEGNEYGGDGDN